MLNTKDYLNKIIRYYWMNKKPNFFIIGEHKSGTTSLHYYLSQHPEIFMSEVKEIGYFHLNKKNDRKYLETYFSNVKDEKIIGESTVGYFYSVKAHKRIKKFNPKAKILLSMRNPLTHIPSSHEEALRSGEENVNSLKKALELEPLRKKGKKLPLLGMHPDRILYYDRSIRKYEMIKNLLRLFPAKQIKIVFMEDLHKKPLKVYRDILKFLEVKNLKFKPSLEIKNPYRKVRAPRIWSLAVNPYTRDVARNVLPKKVFEKAKKTMFKIGFKKTKKPKMDEDLKKMLTKKLKPEVKKLNELLHKHNLIPKNKNLLKFWGYE